MASTENRKIAEKLLRILESSPSSSDMAAIFAGLEKINHRLDKLEAAEAPGKRSDTGVLVLHPSTEKFAISEAADDRNIDLNTKEKACTFEPNGRPCDHCSMCSSRGF